MPGPLDDTLKQLTELSPQDWVARGGWSAAPATLIDADLATLTGATDKVIRGAGRPDWLLAVDFQAGHDTLAKLPDLLLYNSALFKRHALRVRSLLVLLHPGSDSPRVSGLYEKNEGTAGGVDPNCPFGRTSVASPRQARGCLRSPAPRGCPWGCGDECPQVIGTPAVSPTKFVSAGCRRRETNCAAGDEAG
jgi:hypothetical protein